MNPFFAFFQSLFQLPEFRRLVLSYNLPQNILENCRSHTVSWCCRCFLIVNLSSQRLLNFWLNLISVMLDGLFSFLNDSLSLFMTRNKRLQNCNIIRYEIRKWLKKAKGATSGRQHRTPALFGLCAPASDASAWPFPEDTVVCSCGPSWPPQWAHPFRGCTLGGCVFLIGGRQQLQELELSVFAAANSSFPASTQYP